MKTLVYYTVGYNPGFSEALKLSIDTRRATASEIPDILVLCDNMGAILLRMMTINGTAVCPQSAGIRQVIRRSSFGTIRAGGQRRGAGLLRRVGCRRGGRRERRAARQGVSRDPGGAAAGGGL